MKQKTILRGIKLSDYIHPAEERFRSPDNEQGGLIRSGLEKLSDFSVDLLKRITQGKYVQVTATTAPYLTRIVENACRILDYPQMPRLYVRRELSQKISVGGTDHMQLLIPDAILEKYDESMLYYTIGNAISMFKSGHVMLATVCSVMCDNLTTKPFQLPLEAYMRAADLTSDRGGLLTCQDFSAAVRCLMCEAGMPVSELRGMSDDETMAFVKEYLEDANGVCPDWLSTISSAWMRLNWSDAPASYRLKELYQWRLSGYDAVMAKWDRGEACQ